MKFIVKRYVSPKAYATGDKRIYSYFDIKRFFFLLTFFDFDFSITLSLCSECFEFGLWTLSDHYYYQFEEKRKKRAWGCDSDRLHIWSFRVGGFGCQSLWPIDHKYACAHIDFDIYRIFFEHKQKKTSLQKKNSLHFYFR